MAREHGEFRVYVVEVCQRCGWNHLRPSYVLGDGVPRRAPPTPRDRREPSRSRPALRRGRDADVRRGSRTTRRPTCGARKPAARPEAARTHDSPTGAA